jgi:hypothetical protein
MGFGVLFAASGVASAPLVIARFTTVIDSTGRAVWLKRLKVSRLNIVDVL